MKNRKAFLVVVYALMGVLAMVALVVIGKLSLEPHTIREGFQEAWPAGVIIILGTFGSVVMLKRDVPMANLIQCVTLMLSSAAFALTNHIVSPSTWGFVFSLPLSFSVVVPSLVATLVVTLIYERRHLDERPN